MPPTRTPKPPSFMAELFEFSKNTANVPYEDLPGVYSEAGWLTRLVEIGFELGIAVSGVPWIL